MKKNNVKTIQSVKATNEVNTSNIIIKANTLHELREACKCVNLDNDTNIIALSKLMYKPLFKLVSGYYTNKYIIQDCNRQDLFSTLVLDLLEYLHEVPDKSAVDLNDLIKSVYKAVNNKVYKDKQANANLIMYLSAYDYDDERQAYEVELNKAIKIIAGQIEPTNTDEELLLDDISYQTKEVVKYISNLSDTYKLIAIHLIRGSLTETIIDDYKRLTGQRVTKKTILNKISLLRADLQKKFPHLAIQYSYKHRNNNGGGSVNCDYGAYNTNTNTNKEVEELLYLIADHMNLNIGIGDHQRV